MQDQTEQQKHILVIDDDQNATQVLSMLLETKGYTVDVVRSAKEAFRKVSSDYDLILLDLRLPDCHGFDVCRRLKERQVTRHIPIIILSVYSLEEDKIEGLYLGADDFLEKPCPHEELFARMEAIMRRNSIRKDDIARGRDDVYVSELRKILDESAIVPHFQPIYKFHPFRLCGVEVLVRPMTKGKLSDPETFFRAALQYGMYTDMELLVWSMALECIGELGKEEKIFFNCNPYFIESPQFLRAKALFEKHQVPIKNVILEITERSRITNFGLFYKNLTVYRGCGFQFAVDDVGGGYASLETIAEIKPEVVKIDRKIIKDLSTDHFRQSIVKFVVSFCKEHNIMTIAEGIETQQDLDMVRSLGVDAGQGFYLYRPTAKFDMDDFRAVNH